VNKKYSFTGDPCRRWKVRDIPHCQGSM